MALLMFRREPESVLEQMFDDVFQPMAMCMHPSYIQRQFSAPMRQLHQMESDVPKTKVQDDEEKFALSFDVHHFKPEEIKVKTVGNMVEIQAEHEEKQDEHGYVKRSFTRKYTLPQGCTPDAVTSQLDKNGVLTVTAPKPTPAVKDGERTIPITYIGQKQK